MINAYLANLGSAGFVASAHLAEWAPTGCSIQA